ncbi:MAG: JAB domain-containing protein, partial [Pseudomonadota bacterium]|nr:JAB domain-containing protein [Pseudomonadota bacterium]
VAESSQADERITHLVEAAVKLVDIRLMNHLVIGNRTSTSLAAKSMMQALEQSLDQRIRGWYKVPLCAHS